MNDLPLGNFNGNEKIPKAQATYKQDNRLASQIALVAPDLKKQQHIVFKILRLHHSQSKILIAQSNYPLGMKAK